MTSSDTGNSAPYAVVGATGQQGGAVVRALLRRGETVRALARDPGSDAARELASLGATLSRADLGDPATLREAFAGTSGVFAMTTFATERGTEGEVEQGRAIADAAAEVGVPNLVFSSVGGAERGTGIPHFDSKWRVEQYLAEVGVPFSVVRPVFFMDNFTSLFPPEVEDGVSVLRAPLVPDVPLQVIAVSDIGEVAATALLDPHRVPAGGIEIAGDELTAEQVADELGRQAGAPGRFEPVPISSVDDDDAKAMFTWFAELPAYQADFAGTRALSPKVQDFASFVAHRP